MSDTSKAACFLFLASLLVYGNILGNDFAYDDFPFIVGNPAIHLPLTQMFWAPYSADGFWRPVVLFTHAANYAVGGVHPFTYHLFNLLAHAGVVLLLYRLLLDLLKLPRAAFAAALLYAVHPLHTEAVSAAYSRLEILAAGFLFAAWLLHVRNRPWSGAFCFFLALGSKESAICFLAIVVLADWRLDRRVPHMVYAGYGMVAALYLAMRWKAVGLLGIGSIPMIQNPLVDLSTPLRMANALRLAWMMLGLHVYPARLSVDYSYNALPVILEWSKLAGWIAASILLLAIWLWSSLLWKSARWPAVFIAGAIYLAGFALTANFFFVGATNIGERWAYLPSAGFCLLFGLAYDGLAERRRPFAVALLSIVIVTMSVRTVIRNFDWKGNFTLVMATERAYPQSVRAQHAAGLEYLKIGDVTRAKQHFAAAESIYRDYPHLQMSMASLAVQEGDAEGAERHFLAAMRSSAGYNLEPDAVIDYAALQVQHQHYDKALALLNCAIVSWPGRTRAYSNRAVVLYRLNRPALARADAMTALSLNPGNGQATALLKLL
jgi:tetratricopeptide (TPR) repeat protein